MNFLIKDPGIMPLNSNVQWYRIISGHDFFPAAAGGLS